LGELEFLISWENLFDRTKWRFLYQTPLGPKQVISSDELLMSQVVSQEAIIRLLVEQGIITPEEFLEMVRGVNKEMKKEKL